MHSNCYHGCNVPGSLPEVFSNSPFMYEHPKIAVTPSAFFPSWPKTSQAAGDEIQIHRRSVKHHGPASWDSSPDTRIMKKRCVFLISWKSRQLTRDARTDDEQNIKNTKWRQCLNSPPGLPGVTSYVQLCLLVPKTKFTDVYCITSPRQHRLEQQNVWCQDSRRCMSPRACSPMQIWRLALFAHLQFGSCFISCKLWQTRKQVVRLSTKCFFLRQIQDSIPTDGS